MFEFLREKYLEVGIQPMFGLNWKLIKDIANVMVTKHVGTECGISFQLKKRGKISYDTENRQTAQVLAASTKTNYIMAPQNSHLQNGENGAACCFTHLEEHLDIIISWSFLMHFFQVTSIKREVNRHRQVISWSR